MHLVEASAATAAMKARWAELARAIAAAPPQPAAPVAQRQGQLSIMGSGIAHGHLSIDVERHIAVADRVFYSINDHITKNWLRQLRPDGFDLAILYHEAIDRHATYTRMAEALLHYVRQGEHVAAVFYGHPGIFAAPGHRAVQLARKEGHRARMHPGISALDCLVADLGFDPGLPGLLSYEATDLLLRRRRLDPSLHTMLWQVGVVGELGYRREGYGNQGLPLLVDLLEEAYGADFELVHYVGAQYAGGEPLIERLSVVALRDPHQARRLTTLSTFYLAPAAVSETDPARAHAFGAPIRRRPTGVMRDLTQYGPRERKSLASMAPLAFSSGYRVQETSPVIDFLDALQRDIALRGRFERDPAAVLDGPEGAQLTERQKSLLGTQHNKAIIAAITEPGERG
ncbi:MAG: hypothetical protein K2X73_13380 [Sphingomonas sp.]|uniref:SAM-dependent methyltransferase n=1 Tax=Sphingomonas sp. TaxID=28214 RepID=UPI0025FE665C|nr:SAM-dependent methyltransferase [Sphingomonas sp.]MBX9882952.1 hypothetical protein [Sphingomonas sp.]